MRYLIIIAALFLAVTGESVPMKRATIDLTVHPDKGTISASAVLLVHPEEGSNAIQLLLNRRLEVTGLAADVPLKGFRHEKTGHGPYRYAPLATALTIDLAGPASGEPFELQIDIEGEVEPDDWGLTHVTPQWVELEVLYSGWFPFAPGEGLFDIDLRVDIPDGWIMTGTGSPEFEDSLWVAEKRNVKDVVMLASPDMKRLPVGDALTLWHVDLPGNVPEYIISDTETVKEMFNDWFGPVAGSHVDLVFSIRERGGGFARPGLVVMLYDTSFYTSGEVSHGFLRYLAHEVSHLWWHQAPATSWQDWLNESFAEFTALVVLRERFGEDVFKEKIEAYRKSSEGTPPIRGISRGHEQAFTVLYRKGPVILADLETDIGREPMMEFLHALAEQKVDNTADCLDLLEDVVSEDAKKQLEQALAEY
jgi:hypothetical protein